MESGKWEVKSGGGEWKVEVGSGKSYVGSGKWYAESREWQGGKDSPLKNEKKIKKRIKNYEEDSQRQNN